MARLGCLCGHTMTDQTNGIPYKGYILPDVYLEKVSDLITDEIDSLTSNLGWFRKTRWIRNKFGKGYPTNLKDSSMIHDLITSHLLNYNQVIFQCESCGRVAIQMGQENIYKYFYPEESDSKNILNQPV